MFSSRTTVCLKFVSELTIIGVKGIKDEGSSNLLQESAICLIKLANKNFMYDFGQYYH